MNTTSDGIGSVILGHLPKLRRYARALTGSQDSGDTYSAATLEAILEDPSLFDRTSDPRIALFYAFHVVWSSSGAPVGEAGSGFPAVPNAELLELTPNSREALLLHTIEQFSTSEIARIVRKSTAEVEALIRRALEEMEQLRQGRVMIIEDESIIAMDLSAIVGDMGHTVTGIARTHAEAVALARRDRPDLILADIQLADSSSGIDAVNEILAEFRDLPVIFITAFPDRLLTGRRPEPALLIDKPYSEDQVRVAVGQAMFFAPPADSPPLQDRAAVPQS